MKKLALLFIVITSLLLITACKKEEMQDPSTDVEAPEQAPAPTEPETEEETSEESEEKIEEPDKTEIVTELEMVSQARCYDKKIEATVSNPTNETLVLGDTAKIMVNGLVSAYPDCNKLEIGPGESVYCQDITGALTLKEDQKVKIQINMEGERSLTIVEC